MKNTLIICFITLFTALDAFSQSSFIQSLNNIGTITLPNTPQIKIRKKDTIYFTSFNGYTYILQVASLQNKSLVIFGNNTNLEKLYNSITAGTLHGANAQLIYKKNIQIHNLIGVEFGYKSEKKAGAYYGYNQVFYLNNTLINYSLHSIDSLSTDNYNLKTFFNSFKLVLNDKNVKQDDVPKIYHIIERIVSWLIFLVLLFLIGWGIKWGIYKIKNGKFNE